MSHIYRICQTVIRQAIFSKLDSNSYFAHRSDGFRGGYNYFFKGYLRKNGKIDKTPLVILNPISINPGPGPDQDAIRSLYLLQCTSG